MFCFSGTSQLADNACPKLDVSDSASQNSEESVNFGECSVSILELPSSSSETPSGECYEAELNDDVKKVLDFKVNHDEINLCDLLKRNDKVKERILSFNENKGLIQNHAPSHDRMINNTKDNVRPYCSEFESRMSCMLQRENESPQSCKDKNERSDTPNLSDSDNDDNLYLPASDVSMQAEQISVQKHYISTDGIPPKVLSPSQDLSNKLNADAICQSFSHANTDSENLDFSLSYVAKVRAILRNFIFSVYPICKLPYSKYSIPCISCKQSMIPVLKFQSGFHMDIV